MIVFYLLLLFSFSYSTAPVYSSTWDGTALVIDAETGGILGKGEDLKHNFMEVTLQTGSNCDFIGGGVSHVYHMDCSNAKLEHKYPYYNSEVISDMMYDNTNGILYGIMEKGNQKNMNYLYVSTFNPPSGLRRHYTIHELVSFETAYNLTYTSGCLDEKNQRMILKSFEGSYPNFTYSLNSVNLKTKEVDFLFGASTVSDISGCLPTGKYGNETLVYYSTSGQVVSYNVYSGVTEVVATIPNYNQINPGSVSPDKTKFAGLVPYGNKGWYYCDLKGNEECKLVSEDFEYDELTKIVWK